MHQGTIIIPQARTMLRFGLCLCLVSACASSPPKVVEKLPKKNEPAPLKEPLTAIEEIFTTIARHYAGSIPPRPDVIWADAVTRLRQASTTMLFIQSNPPIYRFDDGKGRSLVSTSPSSMDVLRDRFLELIRFCKETAEYHRWAGTHGIEKIVAAALLCNLDSESRLLSPRQMYLSLPERSPSRLQYQKEAAQESVLPAFVGCRFESSTVGAKKNIPLEEWLDSGILVAQMHNVVDNPTNHLKKKVIFAIQQNRGNLRGMVLDLRGSNLAQFEDVRGIADLFLDGGAVMTVQDRRANPIELKTTTDGLELGFPLVVLMDGMCSATCRALVELLRDRGRALIMGQSSSGMSPLQTIYDLTPSLGGMRLTTVSVRTFTGTTLENSVTNPDVLVFSPDEGIQRMGKVDSALQVTLPHDRPNLAHFATTVVNVSKGGNRSQLLDAAKAVAFQWRSLPPSSR